MSLLDRSLVFETSRFEANLKKVILTGQDWNPDKSWLSTESLFSIREEISRLKDEAKQQGHLLNDASEAMYNTGEQITRWANKLLHLLQDKKTSVVIIIDTSARVKQISTAMRKPPKDMVILPSAIIGFNKMTSLFLELLDYVKNSNSASIPEVKKYIEEAIPFIEKAQQASYPASDAQHRFTMITNELHLLTFKGEHPISELNKELNDALYEMKRKQRSSKLEGKPHLILKNAKDRY